MQEEIENRTVTLIISAVKLTARELKAGMDTGNDRDLTVTETGEIQQRCRELFEKCREN